MKGPTAETDWIILGRHVAGEASAAEREQVRAWAGQDPSLRAMLEMLDRAGPPESGVDVEAALRTVKGRFGEPGVIGLPARPRPMPWARLAAALVLLVGAALTWRLLRSPGAASTTLAYATGVGQTDSIRLADGTTAVLGPGSRLEVPAGYGAPDRTVALQGQALFDVPHDPAHRFVVQAGSAEIVDLGTRFTVEAGPEEVRVMVETGAVRLQDTVRQAGGLVLKAGEVGTLGARQATPVPGQRSESDLAWLEGQLVLDNAPLSRVRDDLRRWFGLELVIADSSLARRHVSARFKRESRDQVLEVLRLALGASIERKGDTAFVRPAPPPRHPPN
jgi:transmembrane sensor